MTTTQSTPAPEPMSPDLATQVADFARAVKAAARSVTLYPATHPAIQASLNRVLNASGRLTAGGDVAISVLPNTLAIDGRAPVRPDAAIPELADLLHARLVGSIRIERAADVADWHALLLLLAKAPEELIAEGGISHGWGLTGRSHFELREIDYAEDLRERAGGEYGAWDRILENCLRGDAVDLDDATLDALLDVARDADRFGDFLDRLNPTGGEEGKVGARAAALLRIVRAVIDRTGRRSADELDSVLNSIAQATPRLTPDMMLALLAQREQPGEGEVVVGEILDRMNTGTIASFVARNIVAERGATGRLAQAFEALVPDPADRGEVLDAARDEVGRSSMGEESGFEELWQNAATMLMNYADKPFVSAEYARELSGARAQAIEVDRVSDDPPERIQAWLHTVTPESVRQLDLELLLDLLRLEGDPAKWRDITRVVAAEVERRTLLGDAPSAHALLAALARETAPDGREAFRPAAVAAIEHLAAGPLIRNVVLHLRKADDKDVEPLNQLCHALGPIVIRPLAEALATEENNRALRRLRELLLGFGAAGRQSVEQLKNSPNPAVRRTAIDLLRVFGGREALPELASMLDDHDPQVQRESIRAIVQIGTNEAYAVLERALVGGARDEVLSQLIALRDDKAIPLLCYVLKHTAPRGRLVNVHLAIVDALGALSAHPESTRTLKSVLYGGHWWAPFRTSAMRQAAATALRRIGGPEAAAVLEDAAAHGPRGTRKAARAQVGMVRATPARERVKS